MKLNRLRDIGQTIERFAQRGIGHASCSEFETVVRQANQATGFCLLAPRLSAFCKNPGRKRIPLQKSTELLMHLHGEFGFFQRFAGVTQGE
jgi:hypothetical protein